MATLFSNELALTNQAGAVGNSFSNGSRDIGARQRISVATYTGLGTEAAADTIKLFTLPKGARILGGKLINQAAGGGSLSIGTDTALKDASAAGTAITAGATNLLAATAVAAAGNTPFAATFALGAGAVTDGAGETVVYATLSVATITAGAKLVFALEYAWN